jgi:anti-sigma factor RsiW
MKDESLMIDFDDCDAIDPYLSAFVDEELFGADRATVEGHLAGCDRCRSVVKDYRGWGVALRDAVEAGSARDLSPVAWPPAPARTQDRSPAALTPRRRLFYDVARWLNPWPVFAGAAALVALVVGIGVWNPTAPDRLVEIERIDAAGPVMVFTANEGRTAIIWLSEPEATPPESAPI